VELWSHMLGTDRLGDLGVDERMILKWGLKVLRLWSGQGPVVGFCEHGNEPSGSTKKAGYLLTS